MQIEKKAALLDRVYTIYDDYMASLDIVCDKRCSICCTRNVTMTSLEGFKIISYMNEQGKTALLERLRAVAASNRFLPTITTNQMADLCMQNQEIPDEAPDPQVGKCPFLNDDLCDIYPVRPLACRGLVSTRHCAKTGYADIDDFTLTVNHMLMQYVEHLDANGFSSNLIDLLLFMSEMPDISRYEESNQNRSVHMLLNRPLKMLLIPPEHQEKIRPMLMLLEGV